MKPCVFCGTTLNLWLVNPEGGYGQPEMRACTECLKGTGRDLVPRLLEGYPPEQAEELRKAVNWDGPFDGGNSDTPTEHDL